MVFPVFSAGAVGRPTARPVSARRAYGPAASCALAVALAGAFAGAGCANPDRDRLLAAQLEALSQQVQTLRKENAEQRETVTTLEKRLDHIETANAKTNAANLLAKVKSSAAPAVSPASAASGSESEETEEQVQTGPLPAARKASAQPATKQAAPAKQPVPAGKPGATNTTKAKTPSEDDEPILLTNVAPDGSAEPDETYRIIKGRKETVAVMGGAGPVASRSARSNPARAQAASARDAVSEEELDDLNDEVPAIAVDAHSAGTSRVAVATGPAVAASSAEPAADLPLAAQTIYRSGAKKYLTRQYGEAAPLLASFVRNNGKHPQAAAASQWLAECYVALNKPDAARETLEKSTASHPRATIAPDSLELLARVQRALGDNAAAKKTEETLRARFPASAAARRLPANDG
jgi:TolA-binding protein